MHDNYSHCAPESLDLPLRPAKWVTFLALAGKTKQNVATGTIKKPFVAICLGLKPYFDCT